MPHHPCHHGPREHGGHSATCSRTSLISPPSCSWRTPPAWPTTKPASAPRCSSGRAWCTPSSTSRGFGGCGHPRSSLVWRGAARLFFCLSLLPSGGGGGGGCVGGPSAFPRGTLPPLPPCPFFAGA